MNHAGCAHVLLALFLGCAFIPPLRAADSGASVVVVYNTQMAESKQVADYYAERRHVPASQVFGFKLPVTLTVRIRSTFSRLYLRILSRSTAIAVMRTTPRWFADSLS